ncbi:uncharacterized protein ASPGLDRAFT_35787 [Aspergillus glaucus CBS 516.65]|uniref:Uncharacterized protein n=1 Tax=Aspergillus glaucus CBS 516.65 TaxID=1160497 RepID=A0A1L9VIQ0_ASPGL|nr:hypothetical protein ASPGLDRAFT_35787 [Aspergillus glaucus CBS 516.65]OJJ83763.1 hypothetical protein ASPGLDRAFT_35787 [Aspergillus glaucus CBS 516.65]
MKLYRHIDSTMYKWIVSTQRDLANGNVFFFQIIDDTDRSNLFANHYFNITDGDATTATTTSSLSSSSFPTPVSSLLPSTAISTTASSSDSSSETGGLQPQQKWESALVLVSEARFSSPLPVRYGISVGVH